MNRAEILKRFHKASESFIKANESKPESSANFQPHIARQVAKLESNPRHAPLGAEKVQRQIGERFLVRITSRRLRLLDEDNLCGKYACDLCRYAGIIPDDAPDKCRIETRQVKIKKGEPESIVIEIWNQAQ